MIKRLLSQKGHIASEWIAVMVIMVIVLFAPIPGQDQSLVGLMMQSIRDFHAHGSFIYSLP